MKQIIKFTAFFLIAVLLFASCKKNPAITPPPDIPPPIINNKPPVANAGADRTIILPNDSTEFSGSGTDPDGNIVSYSWTKISGPSSFNIVDPNRAVTKIKNLVAGVYMFELKVIDNDGLTGNDMVIITVDPAVIINQPPLANAGNDQVILLPTNSFELRGSGTDPDGWIVKYEWRVLAYFSQIGQYDSLSYYTATAKVLNLKEGMYWCTLTVTDDKGLTGSDLLVVRVVSPNCPCYPDPCDAFGDPCDPWDY